MGNFLLSSFSLMALIIMLTATLFVVGLKRSGGKADYKEWLLIYYCGLLLWHAMGFVSGGFHSTTRELTYRYTNTLFNLGIAVAGVAYIQVAYLFPQKAFTQERKWVLNSTAALSVVYISLIIWFHFIQNQQGLSSKTYGRFVNPLAGLFGLITTFWAAVVYLRKTRYFRRSKSSHVVPARLLFACTILILLISGLFIYPGGHHQWVIITYTYGMWMVTQAEVLIFIIYAAFPIRFRPKLVSFLFASVMAILSVATMILLPFTDNAETPSNLMQRLADQPTLVRLMLIILGAAVFVLCVFPLILEESLIKPLERLLLGIRKADQGDLSTKVPVAVMDEIGIVTRNFNVMVQSLKQSKDALTNYANTLESQVVDRTTELRNSLKDLQAAQRQLVQSEKMASLGELTAGIAHEIQNPLNFVNNFSETNVELIEEAQSELQAGNDREAVSILNDIKENESKINHHGRRADAIVKAMLQHARTSSGQKEPTNLNALIDEYLRLAYHGFRAKNKMFNATLETHFDESLGKINIVPQEIGRVLLNLFNNAFYALHEQLKKKGSDYKPTLLVSTQKRNDKVEILVKDNAMGISKSVVDKIFQPFFTTKPTGEGTGLGLSLSYDVVKAHGGELNVDSTEGHGTTFIIQLPLV